MYLLDGQMRVLFSIGLVNKLLNDGNISLLQFNTLTDILVQNGISFDVSYDAATRKETQQIQLSIHINPFTTVVFKIGLG